MTHERKQEILRHCGSEALAEVEALESLINEAWKEARDAGECVGVSPVKETSLAALICGASDTAFNRIEALEKERDQLRAFAQETVKALKSATEHIRELADAWQRGALYEFDSKGGTRSNRNHDLLILCADVLAKAEPLLTGQLSSEKMSNG